MLLDIILIVVLVSLVGFGYKKGLMEIVTKIISIVVAFVLAYLLAKTAGEYIANNTNIGAKGRESIQNGVVELLSKKGDLEKYSVLNRTMEDLNINTTNSKAQIAEKVTDYVFVGIGFGAVYLIVRIIAWVATMILDGVVKLPVIKSFNKLGGAIAGFVMFIIEISIILSVIYFASSFEFMKGIVNLINSSVITSTIYNHNIVTHLIASRFMI